MNMDDEHQEMKIPNDKDYSSTLVKEIKCSCQWTIYNFSYLTEDDKSGSIYTPDIESPVFKHGCNKDFVWDINIANLKNKGEEYIKVYVYVNDVEWHDYLDIEATISILDEKGKEAHTIKYKPSVLSTDSVDFIKKSDLVNKNNKLLTDDKLVIVCKIHAFAEVYAYSWNEEDNQDNQKGEAECEINIYRSRLQVSQDLQSLLQNESHDLVVMVKKKQFCVHKGMFAARSRVFTAMFEQEMLEQANNIVIIKDISIKAFEDVIQFIYSGTIKNINNITSKTLTQILVIADKYELNGLKEICEFILSTRLSISNAVEMLSLANFLHAEKLKKFVIQFIVVHSQDFAKNLQFESLLNTHSDLIPCFIEEKSDNTSEISIDFSDDSDDEDNDTRNSCINHIHLPTSDLSLEEKQWGVTQICVEKGSCTWQINQIGLFFNSDMCDYIVSNKFSKDKFDLSWQLFLFLKGIDNDSKDYMSLLLQFSSPNITTGKIKAQYEFAILNGKGETVNNVKSDLLTYSINDSKIGEAKFLKTDKLFNKRMDLLQDTALVITCTITFGLNTQKRFRQSDILNNCEYKFFHALSDDLESLLESGKFSDIQFLVNGKEFSVHRSILAARSPLLLSMIDESLDDQNKNLVKFNDIEPTVFKEILLFIYSGKINNLKELARSLYIEANTFKLEGLMSICEDYLCKNLTLQNVCDNFVFAHINNIRKLKAKCSLFITDNLKAVTLTSGYKSLAQSRPQLLKDIIHKFYG